MGSSKKTTDGFEVYAKQISNLFEKNSSVLEELLNLLVIIAEADGKITNLEKLYLKEVSNIFGFSEQDFERICSSTLNKVTRSIPNIRCFKRYSIRRN